MYEFEGLLFSSPNTIASVLQKPELEKWAEEILDHFNGNPELINDSPETAPSKRLKNTPYRKTTHGPNIIKEMGIPKLRDKCGKFNEWLCKLEALKR